MAVRSARLFDTAALAVADAVVYTVPAGRTAIVKSIICYNRDAATQTVNLAINASASASPVFRVAVATASSTVIDHFWVLNPGDALHAMISGATVGRIVAFGALLDGAPT